MPISKKSLSPFSLRVTNKSTKVSHLLSLLLPIFLVMVTALFFACATPVAPTGGPRDEKGPVILHSEPETGTTNFSEQSIRFYFNEFVNRGTVSKNITVEPDLGITYKLKWKKKRLSIEFDAPLPDSTTVIITLGGNVTDTKNNKMGAPKTIAVSTGDEIDQGSITGRLRSAIDGAPMATQNVFLYRAPINLDEKYVYKAETDTGGVFRFSYLREGEYRALYFDDRNRNKIWDKDSEFAQTFSVDTLHLGEADTASVEVMYVQQQDTLAPKLQAVGLFSSTRMRFRFNENVELSDSAYITINDSLGNAFTTANPLYISPKDGFILFAKAANALNEEERFSVDLFGITDAAGNPAQSTGITFAGSAQEDTTLQRVMYVETETGLFPGQSFSAVYANPITNRTIFDSTVVAEGEMIFDDWPTMAAVGNKLYISPQEETWVEGVDYQFMIWNPQTNRRVLANPEIWDAAEMGEVEISIPGADSLAEYRFSLVNVQHDIRIDSTMNNSVLIGDLPPLSYQLIIFEDVNRNGVWDRGEVEPFVKPEPFYVRPKVQVRTGFASEVIIEF